MQGQDDDGPRYRSTRLEAEQIVNIIDYSITRALNKRDRTWGVILGVLVNELQSTQDKLAELQEAQEQTTERFERVHVIHILDDHPEKRPFVLPKPLRGKGYNRALYRERSFKTPYVGSRTTHGWK